MPAGRTFCYLRRALVGSVLLGVWGSCTLRDYEYLGDEAVDRADAGATADPPRDAGDEDASDAKGADADAEDAQEQDTDPPDDSDAAEDAGRDVVEDTGDDASEDAGDDAEDDAGDAEIEDAADEADSPDVLDTKDAPDDGEVPEAAPDVQPVDPCAEAVASGNQGLLFDGEEASLDLLGVEGRVGTWVAVGDGFTQLHAAVEAPGADSGSALHLATFDPLQRSEGSAVAWLHATEEEVCAYDASKHRGLTFWSKGTTPFLIGVETYDTVTEPHGPCENNCEAFRVAVEPFADWTQYFVKFEDLQQSDERATLKLDRTALMTIEIVIGRTEDLVDIWIDDLAFF